MKMSFKKIVVLFVCSLNLSFSLIAFSSDFDGTDQIPLPLPQAEELVRASILYPGFGEISPSFQGAETATSAPAATGSCVAASAAAEASDVLPECPHFSYDPLGGAPDQDLTLAARTAQEVHVTLGTYGLATPPFPLSNAEATYPSRVAGAQTMLRSQSSRELTAHDRPLQIMIVDDLIISRKVLNQMISTRFTSKAAFESNCFVEQADGASAFMERFEAKRVHLAAKHADINEMTGQESPPWRGPIAHAIFLDQNMPKEIEGSELAWKIRQYELSHGLEFSPIYIFSAGNTEDVLYNAYKDAFSNVINQYSRVLRDQLLKLEDDQDNDVNIADKFNRIKIYKNVDKPIKNPKLTEIMGALGQQVNLPLGVLK